MSPSLGQSKSKRVVTAEHRRNPDQPGHCYMARNAQHLQLQIQTPLKATLCLLRGVKRWHVAHDDALSKMLTKSCVFPFEHVTVQLDCTPNEAECQLKLLWISRSQRIFSLLNSPLVTSLLHKLSLPAPIEVFIL